MMHDPLEPSENVLLDFILDLSKKESLPMSYDHLHGKIMGFSQRAATWRKPVLKLDHTWRSDLSNYTQMCLIYPGLYSQRYQSVPY